MSSFALVLIILLLLCCFLFITIRNNKIKQLNYAVKQNNYETILQLTEQPLTRKIVTNYLCDLYQARAYLLKKDKEALKDHLRSMFKQNYEAKDEEEYLSLYYHIFVHAKDKEFSEEILNRIHLSKNDKLIQYCDWTNLVIFEERNDLSDAMEAVIEEKEYYGFALGTIVYLIGLQKMRLSRYAEALEWLENALAVFQDNEVYVSDVNAAIQELHDLGY